MTSSETQVPSPKGLYAHIRENNFRSIALFAWFVVLLETLYVATSVILISLGSPVETMIRIALGEKSPGGVSAFTRIGGDVGGTFGSANPFAAVPANGWEVWSRFWERDALLGSIGLVIFFVALVYVLVGLWFHSAWTRRQAVAIRVRREDEPRLFGLVEPMAIARGLPMPKLEVILDEGLNAYASGMSPETSVIGVSRGLLKALTDAELEAVLAHEFAHIENRDNRLMTLANLCAGVVTKNSRKTVDHIKAKPVHTVFGFGAAFFIAAWEGLFMGYGAIVLAFFLADGVKHLISQKREFLADARAIEMVKDPVALMTALHKIAQNDKIDGMDPTLQAMMISNVSGTDQWTHPSIEARIAAISATTNVLLSDALQQAPRKNRDRWAGERQTFGARTTMTSSAVPGTQNSLTAQAEARRTSISSDAQPTSTFGQRTAEPRSRLRQQLSHDLSYGAAEQWTEAELKSRDVLHRIDSAAEQVRSTTDAVQDFSTAVAKRMWMLPFVLVAYVVLTALPLSMSLPIMIGVFWTAWMQWHRQKRIARVLEQ